MKNYQPIKTTVTAGHCQKLPGEDTWRKANPSEQALHQSLSFTDLRGSEWMDGCKPSPRAALLPVSANSPSGNKQLSCGYCFQSPFLFSLAEPSKSLFPSPKMHVCVFLALDSSTQEHSHLTLLRKHFVSLILVFVTWEVSIPSPTSNCWPETYVSS